MKVSILIPVYNEFLTLPMVIQRVLAAELPDGTSELAKTCEASPLVCIIPS